VIVRSNTDLKTSFRPLPAAVLIFVLFLIASAVTGQDGGLMLTHFRESHNSEDQNWAICQDNRDIMLFANRRGVVTFDGYNWNLTRLPVIPYTMVFNGNDQRVYIGGEDGYGYLFRNDNGIYEYAPIISDKAFKGIVTGIAFSDSNLYVMSDRFIAVHNSTTLEQLSLLPANDEEPFEGIFTSPPGVFVNVGSGGLFRLEADTLVPLITGYMTAYDNILFTLPYDATRVMLGLASGTIHLFDGLEFTRWEPFDDDYLTQKMLVGGHLVRDTLYLFSTIEGGVLVVGKESRKVYHTINYESGLPDNEVFAAGSDNNSGLWISHEYGLTRADLGIPVRNFGIYPGLSGNLISALWHDEKLYVATSDGLFLLTEVKKYDDVTVYQKVQIKDTRSEISAPGQPAAGDQTSVIPPGDRRNIFNRIFGKKTSSGVEAEEAKIRLDDEDSGTTVRQPVPGYRYEKRTVRQLSSVTHEFRRVEGLTAKCKQMVATSDGLLAATNGGIWLIEDNRAISLVSGRYINRIGGRSEEGVHYIATSEGYFTLRKQDNRWVADNAGQFINQPVYSIVRDKEGRIWLGTDNSVRRVEGNTGSEVVARTYAVPAEFIQRYHVEYIRDTIFVLAESGVFYYDRPADSLLPLSYLSTASARSYILTENGNPIIIADDTPVSIAAEDITAEADHSILRLFEDITSVTRSEDALWITDESNRVFRIEPAMAEETRHLLSIFIGGKAGPEPFFDIETADISGISGVAQFNLIAPWYINQGAVQYQYFIPGVNTSWSEWSASPVIIEPVRPGSYTLLVRARAISGIESEIKELQFRVKPRFTETKLFYFLVLSVLLMAVFALIRFRERKLLHDKMVLEERVRERTAEIEAQKKEITSSIEYARRIQQAMLPAETIFRETFGDYFILFRPRDIVSGDFYWIAEENGRVSFTVADCTGHGVPGAFMSMLGISALNDIINSNSYLSASSILDLLRESVKRSLKQTGKTGETADGMDMALCVFEPKTGTMEFAGAYNSMFHFRDARLTEHRGDKMPIGIFYGEKKHFTNHHIDTKPGDVMYLTTDGFADQFGGTSNSKYKIKNLKLFLTTIKDLPMAEQKRLLNEEFDRWKGDNDQIDDIAIIGIRV
jgi:serine phosphatase RsbU (regulator of sigma subunit)